MPIKATVRTCQRNPSTLSHNVNVSDKSPTLLPRVGKSRHNHTLLEKRTSTYSFEGLTSIKLVIKTDVSALKLQGPEIRANDSFTGYDVPQR